MKNTFAIGDRVKLHPHMPVFHAMTHGVVVYYRGALQPETPRVRWATGWATSTPAGQLIHLTPEELQTLPPPETIPEDHVQAVRSLPLPHTWWRRKCNGWRYYLRDEPKGAPGFERVWIFREGTNRCLHIKATSLLKNYDQIDTTNTITTHHQA